MPPTAVTINRENASCKALDWPRTLTMLSLFCSSHLSLLLISLLYPDLPTLELEPAVFLRGQSASGEDARGRRRPVDFDAPPSQLRALLTLTLNKPSKIRDISIALSGTARTDWPEGIGPNRLELSEETNIIKQVISLWNAKKERELEAAQARLTRDGTQGRRRCASLGPTGLPGQYGSEIVDQASLASPASPGDLGMAPAPRASIDMGRNGFPTTYGGGSLSPRVTLSSVAARAGAAILPPSFKDLSAAQRAKQQSLPAFGTDSAGHTYGAAPMRRSNSGATVGTSSSSTSPRDAEKERALSPLEKGLLKLSKATKGKDKDKGKAKSGSQSASSSRPPTSASVGSSTFGGGSTLRYSPATGISESSEGYFALDPHGNQQRRQSVPATTQSWEDPPVYTYYNTLPPWPASEAQARDTEGAGEEVPASHSAPSSYYEAPINLVGPPRVQVPGESSGTVNAVAANPRSSASSLPPGTPSDPGSVPGSETTAATSITDRLDASAEDKLDATSGSNATTISSGSPAPETVWAGGPGGKGILQRAGQPSRGKSRDRLSEQVRFDPAAVAAAIQREPTCTGAVRGEEDARDLVLNWRKTSATTSPQASTNGTPSPLASPPITRRAAFDVPSTSQSARSSAEQAATPQQSPERTTDKGKGKLPAKMTGSNKKGSNSTSSPGLAGLTNGSSTKSKEKGVLKGLLSGLISADDERHKAEKEAEDGGKAKMKDREKDKSEKEDSSQDWKEFKAGEYSYVLGLSASTHTRVASPPQASTRSRSAFPCRATYRRLYTPTLAPINII